VKLVISALAILNTIILLGLQDDSTDRRYVFILACVLIVVGVVIIASHFIRQMIALKAALAAAESKALALSQERSPPPLAEKAPLLPVVEKTCHSALAFYVTPCSE
jgi:hypothetical protein